MHLRVTARYACANNEDELLRKIMIATAALLIGATPALACTEDDVFARQGELVAAVQALLIANPAKAQELVLTMQAELDAASAAGDGSGVCDMMDRLLADAKAG